MENLLVSERLGKRSIDANYVVPYAIGLLDEEAFAPPSLLANILDQAGLYQRATGRARKARKL